MRLESYSMPHESEDLMLYALLHDVEKGFYIDVGANDPTFMSVTKLFYDRGWRGINIEPVDIYCKKLEMMRPRDINLCVGCGSENGQAFMYDVKEKGLPGVVTFSDKVKDKNWNAKLLNGNLDDPEKYRRKDPTPILTLSEISRQYCPPPPENQVHFCKIDVEGFEKEVLLGINDWEKLRPWVFCIEATLPYSMTPCHEEWEYILVEHGYQFLFSFGVNRYYLDSKKGHLRKNLSQVKEFLQQFEIIVFKIAWMNDLEQENLRFFPDIIVK